MTSPRSLACVGFLMLLLTSLQGWAMVGIIGFSESNHPELLAELKRLHNLGLTGGFLAISFGVGLRAFRLKENHERAICRLLMPSLLIAPAAFCDRTLLTLTGSMPFAFQATFYGLQAFSALGITVSLGCIVIWLFNDRDNGR